MRRIHEKNQLHAYDELVSSQPFALPVRPVDGNKGTFGRVTVIGGCSKYPGAPVLSGKAAYRTGCGLVEMVVPEVVRNCMAAFFPEAIWNCDDFENGEIQLTTDAALVIGPGLGNASFLRQKVVSLLQAAAQKTSRILIDADGLNTLAQDKKWSEQIPHGCVLTPHPGEMSRLCGLPVSEIQSSRKHIAEEYAVEWQQILLLKGANTIIAAPNQQSLVLSFASSALAVAGSGDVLSGIIGSLMAQGMRAFEAACLGAWLHAMAGSLAAIELGNDYSVIAGDILTAIPGAIASAAD